LKFNRMSQGPIIKRPILKWQIIIPLYGIGSALTVLYRQQAGIEPLPGFLSRGIAPIVGWRTQPLGYTVGASDCLLSVKLSACRCTGKLSALNVDKFISTPSVLVGSRFRKEEAR
jgi:hypothetical protein